MAVEKRYALCTFIWCGGVYKFFILLLLKRGVSFPPFHLSVDKTQWLASSEHNTAEVIGCVYQN